MTRPTKYDSTLSPLAIEYFVLRFGDARSEIFKINESRWRIAIDRMAEIRKIFEQTLNRDLSQNFEYIVVIQDYHLPPPITHPDPVTQQIILTRQKIIYDTACWTGGYMTMGKIVTGNCQTALGFVNAELSKRGVGVTTEPIMPAEEIVKVKITFTDGTIEIGNVKRSQIPILQAANQVLSVEIVSSETQDITKLTPTGETITPTPQNPFIKDRITGEKIFTKEQQGKKIVKIRVLRRFS